MSWHALQDLDDTFFRTAPHVYRYPIDLDVPPERVWQSLTSEESVSAWGPFVKSLRWTSPRPFGVGTTREVTLPLGVITVREQFLLWEEGRHYRFRATHANRPLLRRFGEDYVVEPHGTGSRLTWTFALEAEPNFHLLIAAASPLNRLSFGHAARGARSYFAENPH